MGQVFSRTWFIYGRDHSDNWIDKPLDSTLAKEDDTVFHMGRFKHQVFLLALKLAHISVSKMYLYHGWRRAKCEKTESTIVITFSDTEARKAWGESIPSRLQTLFDSTWEKISADDYVYTYKLLQK